MSIAVHIRHREEARRSLRRAVGKRLRALVKSGALSGAPPDIRRLEIDEILQALLADSRPLVRRVLADCAGSIPRSVRVTLLLQLVSDTDPEVRYEAIEAIGSALENAPCPPALLRRLCDPDMLVRTAAAAALGQIGDERVLKHLWPVLQDPVPLVRSYAAAAIGRLGNRLSIERLKARLARERSSTARIGFYEAISSLGDESLAVEGLVRLFAAEDYSVRCAAANCLGEIHLSGPRVPQVRAALRQAVGAERTRAGREALLRAIRVLRSRRRAP